MTTALMMIVVFSVAVDVGHTQERAVPQPFQTERQAATQRVQKNTGPKRTVQKPVKKKRPVVKSPTAKQRARKALANKKRGMRKPGPKMGISKQALRKQVVRIQKQNARRPVVRKKPPAKKQLAAKRPVEKELARKPPIAKTSAADIYESPVAFVPTSELDKIVFAQLASLGVKPVRCSDAVFVRRAFLDMIGTLPSAEEARSFIEDSNSNKRSALIERLLERDEFADYWSMKWGDVLRIKAEFPINLWPNAAQAYHRWVRASIAQNKPYDEFVRELLTSSGSNFRVGPVNFYRAIQNKTPEGVATAVALAFMGSRTEAWPEDRLAGMAVFFSQIGYKPTREWKEECVFWDPFHTSPAIVDGQPLPAPSEGPQIAVFPDGTKVELSAGQDPREVFADWLITPQNPWFTRSIANRIWAWIMGRGIVHEPDDIRADNPPSNPKLLAYLESELIASRYDLKHLYRLILTSDTYQFSSMPRFQDPQAIANFASYPLRRLEAEVLIDAINTVTGTSDLYTSAIPEPFTYIPKDLPAIALADGSITSPFLALFGRSARATGMENERDNKLAAAQWLHLLNSSHIQRKIEQGPKIRAIITSRRKMDATAEELYLTILSRFPTEAELANLRNLVAKPSLRREQWIDVSWALINSTEFLFRH